MPAMPIGVQKKVDIQVLIIWVEILNNAYAHTNKMHVDRCDNAMKLKFPIGDEPMHLLTGCIIRSLCIHGM